MRLRAPPGASAKLGDRDSRTALRLTHRVTRVDEVSDVLRADRTAAAHHFAEWRITMAQDSPKKLSAAVLMRVSTDKPSLAVISASGGSMVTRKGGGRVDDTGRPVRCIGHYS